MRMCFMQEARRDSVPCSYVWKVPRLDHWVTRGSRALVFVYYSAVEVPEQFSMMLKQNLEKNIEPTNETGHVEFYDSQSVWSRNKQQTKQV